MGVGLSTGVLVYVIHFLSTIVTLLSCQGTPVNRSVTQKSKNYNRKEVSSSD